MTRSAAAVIPADARSRTKRVAIFSDALPERNGAGAYYADLVAQLGPFVERIEIFQPTPRRRLRWLALPLPGDKTQQLILPNLFRLWRQYRALRPDVVVAVTPGPFGLLGLFLAWRHRTGFLIGFHTQFGELMRLYGNTLFFRLAYRYLRFINQILCRRSDAVMVNNARLAATVRELGAKTVEVMGTALAEEFLRTPPPPAPERFARVLFAGRLAPEKNLPAILAAARALPALEFVLVGDGPLRASLEREAAALPNVRLTGWLDRPGLRREMDAASLLLLPSHLETFGTVALEAMARGRPALVAANAGIHDWAVLREALFVLPADETLASALARLQALPPETWAAKRLAARAAAEQLNRETVAQWADFVSRYARSRDET